MNTEKKTGCKSTSHDPLAAQESSPQYGKRLDMGYTRSCSCEPSHINCMTAKEWLKSQLGVWQFFYEPRDVRDKTLHPATFPIALSKRVIELFTHQGELILDPFVGSGTTLVAACDTDRNAVGFDLQGEYTELYSQRLSQSSLFTKTKQVAIQDDKTNFHRERGYYEEIE